jgi:hypothetical protein
MSREDKLAVLEAIIGNPASDPQHIARAVEVHSRLAGEAAGDGAAAAPDPAWLAEYLRRAGQQGMEPVAPEVLAGAEGGKSL